jgi:hypothetical protein
MNKYQLLKFEGVGEHAYREVKEESREFDNLGEAITAYQEIVGETHIWEALEMNLGDMIYWVTDIEGYELSERDEIN